MIERALIFDAVRTPRGRPDEKGSLHGVKSIDLLAPLYGAIHQRNELKADAIDDVVLGCVTQMGEQGTNIARLSALCAGLADTVSGMTLNRFCTSGIDAVQVGAMKVAVGSDQLVLAGGVESSSRVPMFSDEGVWFKDPRVAQKTGFVHMGISADLVATRAGLSREELDRYAEASQQKAARATESGAFKKSMVPVGAEGVHPLKHDELIRPQTTYEKLSALPPAFAELGQAGGDRVALKRYPQLAEIDHVHHLGSSPALADGASLVLMGNEVSAKAHGLKARGRVLGIATTAVEPTLMLTGNVSATEKALEHAKLSMNQMDLVEINESFAAIPLHFQRHFDVPDEKLNVMGGAIAMGHPLGATGGILVNTLLDTLEARGSRYGVATVCGGAGVASAVVIEALN